MEHSKGTQSGWHEEIIAFVIASETYTQEIIKTAFEAGINMLDTAEEYSGGKSEEEMYDHFDISIFVSY